MANIRVFHNKDNPYVQLNKKTLQSEDISWGAKGLWAYLQTLDVEEINVEELAKEFYISSVKEILDLLAELKDLKEEEIL